MTLITAVVSRNWVALASDRRISFSQAGQTPTWQEDATVKSVIHDRRYILGFAGTVPPGEHVDMWIASLLTERRAEAVDDFLRRRLCEQWNGDPRLRGRAAAIVGVGFRQDGRAHGFLVSNAFTPQGDVNIYNVRPKFDKRGFSAPSARQIGEYTEPEDHQSLSELAETGAVLGSTTMQSLVTLMVDVHHAVADSSEERVGREFLLTTLPIRAVGGRAGGGIVVPTSEDGLRNMDTEIIGLTVNGRGLLSSRFGPGVSFSRSYPVMGGMAMAGLEVRGDSSEWIGPLPSLGSTPPSQQ